MKNWIEAHSNGVKAFLLFLNAHGHISADNWEEVMKRFAELSEFERSEFLLWQIWAMKQEIGILNDGRMKIST